MPTCPEMYEPVVAVAPLLEPLTRAEAKLHCRVDQDMTDEDSFFEDAIKEARQYCEQVSGRSFITRTLRLPLDTFPGWRILLPRGPVQSVTSVIYRDVNGTLTTMDAADYLFDSDIQPAYLQPKPYSFWPWTEYWRAGSVKITYVAGYGAAATSVPGPVKRAMKMLVGHWYDHRESIIKGMVSKEVEFSVGALLTSVWDGRY